MLPCLISLRFARRMTNVHRIKNNHNINPLTMTLTVATLCAVTLVVSKAETTDLHVDWRLDKNQLSGETESLQYECRTLLAAGGGRSASAPASVLHSAVHVAERRCLRGWIAFFAPQRGGVSGIPVTVHCRCEAPSLPLAESLLLSRCVKAAGRNTETHTGNASV